MSSCSASGLLTTSRNNGRIASPGRAGNLLRHGILGHRSSFPEKNSWSSMEFIKASPHGFLVRAHLERLLARGVIDTAPTTVASQNAIQNALANAPDFVKESPERVLIAVSLVAAAVIGYLLSQKVREP